MAVLGPDSDSAMAVEDGEAGSAAVPDILRRLQARESAARTYARHLPIVPVRARGMVVQSADGKRYLDCLSGAGTLVLGHNHPVVIEAIRAALDAGTPMHVLDLATMEKDAFVDTLFHTLPAGLAANGRVQFCSPAGTDAVEAALKLAQTATGRRGVLSFTGAYHGMTLGALTASGGVAAKTAVSGIGADVTRLPYPYSYRCPFGLGAQAGDEVAAAYVGRLLADPNGGVVPPAAMIVEPVQGEGGVVPAPDEWLRAMRNITTRHGIPLIADEVQTGVGRTGAMWATQHAGVEPDVMVFSKAIGGGLPLAVVVYHEDLDRWAPGAHAGTFRGNNLAMAAGAATLRYVVDNDLPQRAAELGAVMRGRLEELEKQHPCVGEIRGRGLMLGLELVEADAEPDQLGARPAAPRLAQALRAECLRRGLIVELGGRHDAVVRLLPPLTITDEQAEAVLDRLADALAAVDAGGTTDAGAVRAQR